MARPFPDILRELSGGRIVEELTDIMRDLSEQVIMHHAQGSVTIKLNIRPNGENSIAVNPRITVTPPVVKRGDSIFFSNKGDLVRNDPRQAEMPFGRRQPATIDQPAQPAPAEPVKETVNG